MITFFIIHEAADPQIGQTDEELQTYFSAIQKYPNSSYLYKRIGDFYYDNENFKESLDMYSKAIEIDSIEAYIFFNKGFTQWKLGKQASAIQDWYKASSLAENKFYSERAEILAKTADSYWWIPFESLRLDIAYTKAHYKPEYYYHTLIMFMVSFLLFPLLSCYALVVFWRIRKYRKLKLKNNLEYEQE